MYKHCDSYMHTCICESQEHKGTSRKTQLDGAQTALGRHWRTQKGKTPDKMENTDFRPVRGGGREMVRLDKRRRTGEGGCVPTFWPNLHLSACSLGHSSGERSGTHSYWLTHWLGTQCLQERTTTKLQQNNHRNNNTRGERYCEFLRRAY